MKAIEARIRVVVTASTVIATVSGACVKCLPFWIPCLQGIGLLFGTGVIKKNKKTGTCSARGLNETNQIDSLYPHWTVWIEESFHSARHCLNIWTLTTFHRMYGDVHFMSVSFVALNKGHCLGPAFSFFSLWNPILFHSEKTFVWEIFWLKYTSDRMRSLFGWHISTHLLWFFI